MRCVGRGQSSHSQAVRPTPPAGTHVAAAHPSSTFVYRQETFVASSFACCNQMPESPSSPQAIQRVGDDEGPGFNSPEQFLYCWTQELVRAEEPK